MDRESIDKICRERGIKILPPDHRIYNEPPSVFLIRRLNKEAREANDQPSENPKRK